MTAIENCLPANHKKAALHEPYFGGREWDYVKECMDSGWVSSTGPFVERFEQQTAEFTGVGHAVAAVNGTAALHICLLLAGVRPGDEVLTPALTFVATTNAIAYCNGHPHFVDSDSQTLGVAPEPLEAHLGRVARHSDGVCYNKNTGRVIRALIVMHTLGHPADLDALAHICRTYHLTLIEDAAEALGSYYRNQHVGSHGALSALSFNGNKIITTGGGGMILTHDPNLAARAKHLTTTAKLTHPWAFQHDELGYNYRLPNLNAALGCAQLEQLPRFLTAKRGLASRYKATFASIPGVCFIDEPPNTQSNYWLNALLLDTEKDRDALLTATHQRNIFTRPIWTLQPNLPMYQHCQSMRLPVAECLASRLVNLPSSVFLSGVEA